MVRRAAPRPGRAAPARASRTSSPSCPARAASARARSASTSPSRSPRPAQRVGLLDADITGPNIPLMMGLEGQPVASPNNKIIAARAPRRQGDLDPVLRPRGPADRLARAARRRRDPAVPARRRMGRARLPRHRPAAGDVRRPADARPGGPDQRRRPRHDAPGGLPARRRQGPRHAQADERAGHRDRREHGRLRLRPLRRGHRDLRPGRRRAVRAASTASSSSARSRSTSRSARAPTSGSRPSPSASRDRPPRR